jgi:anti-sigma B factor antagonist
MHVDVGLDGPTVVATVTGEVDSHNCGDFAAAVREPIDDNVERVEIDLSGLTFIDSSGLSELVKLHNELRDRDAVLVVRNPTPTVERVLEITGLAEPFGLT